MQNYIGCLLFAFLSGLTESNAQSVLSNPPSQDSPVNGVSQNAVAIQKYAKLPLSFERKNRAEFVARGDGYVIDISGPRATVVLPKEGTVQMEFVRGRHVAASPANELPGKVNYILGNDSRKWRLGLSTYERVAYHDVYPGIDLVYYGNPNQLEFDLILKPHANLAAVEMHFSGPARPRIDHDGTLLLGGSAPKGALGDPEEQERSCII